jgi:hypothetical protein
MVSSIQQHLKVKEKSQGWADSQMVMSLVLINLAGGDCVDDLKILEADEGFCTIFMTPNRKKSAGKLMLKHSFQLPISI